MPTDSKDKAIRERSLLLRYACERIARSVYKAGSWRQVARSMEEAALFEAVCSAEARTEMRTMRRRLIEQEAPK